MADYQKLIDNLNTLANDVGATPAEREAALSKMAMMMDKYKLEVSISMKKPNATHEEHEIFGKYPKNQSNIASCIQEIFDVRVLYLRDGDNGHKLLVIGTPENIKLYVIVFRGVINQMWRDLDKSGLSSKSQKDSFMKGYMLGLLQNVRNIMAERNKNEDIYAIVLSSDAENSSYIAETWDNVREETTQITASDSDALHSGWVSGKSAIIDKVLDGQE